MVANRNHPRCNQINMFSKRFKWDAKIHPLSETLGDLLAAGRDVIDLTDANPTRAHLIYPAKAILAALARPQAMVYTPAPQGLPVAREAVARYYRQIGRRVSRDAILLTAGTSEAYGLLFKLLADPGDEILIPRPGYPLLSHLAGFEGLTCHSYPLRYEVQTGWRFDPDLTAALITHRTRAMVVVNPNNPTGNYLTRAELAAIDAMCRRHEVALIVDEVFADFADRPAPGRVATAVGATSALTFVLNGISKVLGLPQMKLAWIVCCGDPARSTLALRHLETLMDFYLTVATPVQIGLPRLLARRISIQRRIKHRIDDNARYLAARVQATSNMRLLIREGGWYAVLAIEDAVGDETRALELLEQDHILIHPGLFYDFYREGFVVLSLLPRPDRFSTGVDRLVRRYGEPATQAQRTG